MKIVFFFTFFLFFFNTESQQVITVNAAKPEIKRLMIF